MLVHVLNNTLGVTQAMTGYGEEGVALPFALGMGVLTVLMAAVAWLSRERETEEAVARPAIPPVAYGTEGLSA